MSPVAGSLLRGRLRVARGRPAAVVLALAVAVLIPVLIGALLVHVPDGWLFTAANGGWEYPAFLMVASVVQALIGAGAYAVNWPLQTVRLARA